jgi:ATP-dependent DNA helicase PIF1
MGSELPFGGKVMVFGGDFRQVLPIVPRGTRAQLTDATLLRSYIWKDVQKICLTRNMRAQSDPCFLDYLLRIGNGTEDTFVGDYVRLPKDIVIEYKDKHFIDRLINCVFPNLNINACSTQYMSERGILCTSNDYMDEINARMIDRFLGIATVFHSFDPVDDDERNNYPQDFLSSITPNGLLSHELRIKINCPLILLRNLDPRNGLCNGTRLVVKAVNKHILDVEIVNGTHAGDRVFIPRILLSPSEDLSPPFKFKMKQFPMCLSFAMTINKAQGHTLPTVGVYLPQQVFSHVQLYVALSRGVSQGSTWVLCKPSKEVDPKGNTTRNIVYIDVLGT